MIVLSLVGHYLKSVRARNAHFVRGLFFCWAGDILLLMQEEEEIFFLLGLFAFLVGHLLYTLAYRQLQWNDESQSLKGTERLRVAFPVFLAGTGLLTVLIPRLGGLTIPVILYAVVLMAMVATAALRYGRTSLDSYLLLVSGAILFMISDSILAINKFHTAFPMAAPAIMLTYILGQYLIVEGAIRHQRLEPSQPET
jgi:uncharacterized membrane protein YhhN